MNEGIGGGDPAADDFDLFWGMPSRVADNNSHASRGLGEVASGGAGLMSSQSDATLSSSNHGDSFNATTSTLMGSLWSHGGVPPEAYGHSLHVHASQAEISASDAAGLHAGSPPPPPSSSRSSVWLQPPSQHRQLSAGCAAGGGGGANMHASGRQRQHHHPGSPPQPSRGASAEGDTALAAMKSGAAGNTGMSGSNVEYRLEELAAAITSSVLGKLDVGVREALAGHQQNHQRLGGGSAVAPPAPAAAAAQEDDQRRAAEEAAAAAAEAAVAPLRARLAAIEEQVSRLAATESRSSGGDSSADTTRGGRGGSSGHGEGGGNATAEPLAALTALAQRTGTLEGRHKQVQAKLALLDNAFGPKASDWAQTIKAFLQEREGLATSAAGRGAGIAAATAGGVATRGKGGKRSLGIDAPVFVPQSAQRSSEGPLKGAATPAVPAPAGSSVVVTGTRHDDSTPEAVGAPKGDCTGPTAAKGPAAATATTGETREAHRGGTGAETPERYNRLEKRVAESERALSLLQSQAEAATAATAEMESRRIAAAAVAAENAASLDLLGQKQKATAAAVAGGGGNWASKASLDKLASGLRQLTTRTKNGEDALALVDHGLKGVRDEIVPLSGSVLALKRLVESHLREKEQAAELLKGYVTTITREVAMTSRQYINGLLISGGLPPAAAANSPSRGDGKGSVQVGQSAAAVPAAAAAAAGPTTRAAVGATRPIDGSPPAAVGSGSRSGVAAVGEQEQS